MAKPRTCRICKCTEAAACITPGGPCSWVGARLCSNPSCIIAVGLVPERYLARLSAGCSHRDGVITAGVKLSNFDKPEGRMAKLVALGLAIPNAHGDWYITANGRRVFFLLTQENDHGRE